MIEKEKGMKYFLDTEFIEAPNHLDLISIGIVAEDGREFYAENCDADWSAASQWVLDNVRPYVRRDDPIILHHDRIGFHIGVFMGDDPAPEFWGYYASWDWTAICWLMGGMLNTPQGWPMFCRDLRQALDAVGLEHVKQPDDAPHHALSDARWVAETYKAHFTTPRP